MSLSVVGYTVVLFSLPDNAARLGFSSQQGSVAGSLANVGMAVGRPITGYYSDTLGRTNIITLATALCGLLCLCMWTTAQTYAYFLAFSFLSGCVLGTCWTVYYGLNASDVTITDLL